MLCVFRPRKLLSVGLQHATGNDSSESFQTLNQVSSMDESSPPAPASPSAEKRPASKRRKLRNGTVSCWTCKLRKVRCEYDASTSAVRNGCRRQATNCISQDFAEDSLEYASGGDNQQVGARLVQMEALIQHLTTQLSTRTT